jgi:hypothetical protein
MDAMRSESEWGAELPWASGAGVAADAWRAATTRRRAGASFIVRNMFSCNTFLKIRK